MVFAYYQWQLHTPGIFGEMWDNLAPVQQMAAWGVHEWLAELFRRYAGSHVLFFPKLVFFADFHWFGASGVLSRAASWLAVLGCVGLSGWLLARDFAWRDSLSGSGWRYPSAFVLAAAIYFSPLEFFVINWQSLLQYTLSVLFGLACAVFLQRQQFGRAWLAALLAALCCGAGVAALGLVLGSVVAAISHRKIVKVRACALLLLTLIALWLVRPEPQLFALGQYGFSNGVSLYLQLLAYPISAFFDARAVGLCVLLGVLYSGINILRYRADIYDFVIVFAALVLLSITVGRFNYIPWDSDISRYYIFMAPLWFGVFAKFMLWQTNLRLLALIAAVSFSLLAGLPLLAVTQSVAQKMLLANTVFFNGNTEHYARLKLDVLNPGNRLAQEQAYLKQHQLDVFYRESLPRDMQSTATCHLQLIQQRFATKRRYQDSWFAETENVLQTLWAIKADGEQKLAVRVAKQLPLDGWFLTPKTVSWREHWQLLLPVSWLSAEQARWFTHLSAEEKLDQYEWYGRTQGGHWCRVQFQVAPN